MDPLRYLCLTFVFILLSCMLLACWERADLLTLLYVLFPCVYDVSGQMWYLIVSIPDLCLLLYFYKKYLVLI